MLKTLSAASVTLLLAGTAAPALAQSAYDWSGPYVGVYGGYIEPDDEANETLVFDRDFDGAFDDMVVTDTGDDAFVSFCGDQASGSNRGRPCNPDGSGVEGGFKAGYDWQFGGGWVVGAVGEWSVTDVKDAVSGFSSTPAIYTLTRDLESTAALRARVGYASGPALGYVTAGVAYGKIENRFFTSNGANSFTVMEDEDDADGFQFGGGVEWRLAPSLTLNGEYIYTDLEAGEHVIRAGNNGTTPATNPFILPPNTVGTDITRSSDAFKTHSFRVGMNVRF